MNTNMANYYPALPVILICSGKQKCGQDKPSYKLATKLVQKQLAVLCDYERVESGDKDYFNKNHFIVINDCKASCVKAIFEMNVKKDYVYIDLLPHSLDSDDDYDNLIDNEVKARLNAIHNEKVMG